MCAITGYFGGFDPSLLTAMSARLRHRGPDGEGAWNANGIGLAHRRLAIIDLSESGRQPMWDVNRRACIVFNGEIYNYKALRLGLERDGFKFAGASDTEVLLNLWLRDGNAALGKLNGIYAFSIYDPTSRRLVCARDPMGIKPFYYCHTPEGFVFASELKALLAVPHLDLSIDPRAIASYLALLWAPGELTPLSSVRKLLPGYAVELQEGESPLFWRFAEETFAEPVVPTNRAAASRQCEARLSEAVNRQLVSDVPVGGFLSGGVDSCAIAQMAVEHLRDPSRYPCYTIGFDGGQSFGEGFGDDLSFARSFAKQLAVPLRVVTIPRTISDDLDFMVWHLDEPEADFAALNTYYICRAAADEGVKVLLSGVGGDDIFGGYRRHQALFLDRLLGSLPQPVRAFLARTAGTVSQKQPSLRRLTKYLRYLDREKDARLTSLYLWLDQGTLSSILSEDFASRLKGWTPAETLLATMKNLPPLTSDLNRLLHIDQRHFLPDHNLNYTDKMSMACGVEVRVPFLDPDLVRFAARLPSEFKCRPGRGKAVLKEALRGKLPDAILNRPKTGFGVPLRRWIHEVLRPRFDDLLDSGRLEATGVFDAEGVRKTLDQDRSGQIDASYPLLGVLCIESWIRQFLVR